MRKWKIKCLSTTPDDIITFQTSVRAYWCLRFKSPKTIICLATSVKMPCDQYLHTDSMRVGVWFKVTLNPDVQTLRSCDIESEKIED